MLKLVNKIHLIMEMEKLVSRHGHLTTVADYENLLKEKEECLDEIEKQESASEV